MPEKIFVAKVHGEYIAQRGRDRILRSYEAKFRLPNAQSPLAMIKGKLLKPFLRKLDPNAVEAYTYYLDELAPENGEFDPDEIPVMFQSFRQLAIFCKRHKLGVPTEEYGDLEMLRAHVQIALDDPQTFQTLYAKYKNQIDADRELNALNQDFEGIGEVKEDVAIDTETGKIVPRPQSTEVKPQTTSQAKESFFE